MHRIPKPPFPPNAEAFEPENWRVYAQDLYLWSLQLHTLVVGLQQDVEKITIQQQGATE